ncbi:uncharacterized protein LACBIDRAFT_333013 [Laccaria bicolor S238N-H82]|uniref:Predicted protein n=1 Tax=Laccaria bicolor (strain S238N-H82 / ATCC MYA-4686) TaxID=486041 RepID=B0DUJ7_LACBS|nr:uncharacterized protein LACBIDRAFT_333013 [Laccaria bicolor S238N-H82]EDR01816.1 predicted protein [Laccaria bicolor S238N-H82]|eukprot:XP_001887629.1 predicted protein [Laccaria bicolor S238N-H82]
MRSMRDFAAVYKAQGGVGIEKKDLGSIFLVLGRWAEPTTQRNQARVYFRKYDVTATQPSLLVLLSTLNMLRRPNSWAPAQCKHKRGVNGCHTSESKNFAHLETDPLTWILELQDQLSDLAARPPLFRSLLISSAIRARTLISNTVPAHREVLDPRSCPCATGSAVTVLGTGFGCGFMNNVLYPCRTTSLSFAALRTFDVTFVINFDFGYLMFHFGAC